MNAAYINNHEISFHFWDGQSHLWKAFSNPEVSQTEIRREFRCKQSGLSEAPNRLGFPASLN